MKKYLVYFMGLVIILCGSFLAYQIINKRAFLERIASNKQTLPDFRFKNLDGSATGNKFLKSGKSVCIFYFNADCEHCRYEVRAINKNIDKFKSTQIVMVSFNTVVEIRQFANAYNLNQKNVTFLQDSNYEFYKWFGKTSVPAIFIYNGKRKLVKEFHGETKIEDIIKCLQ